VKSSKTEERRALTRRQGAGNVQSKNRGAIYEGESVLTLWSEKELAYVWKVITEKKKTPVGTRSTSRKGEREKVLV